jgi:hypothetical protein
MIRPLLIEWLWRWELWLAMTAADERGLQARRCIWAWYRFVGNSALEWPEPFPQLRVQHRRTLFGAENTMNIERARGVGHGRLCSGITLGSGSINLPGERIILVVFDTHQSKG